MHHVTQKSPRSHKCFLDTWRSFFNNTGLEVGGTGGKNVSKMRTVELKTLWNGCTAARSCAGRWAHALNIYSHEPRLPRKKRQRALCLPRWECKRRVCLFFVLAPSFASIRWKAIKRELRGKGLRIEHPSILQLCARNKMWGRRMFNTVTAIHNTHPWTLDDIGNKTTRCMGWLSRYELSIRSRTYLERENLRRLRNADSMGSYLCTWGNLTKMWTHLYWQNLPSKTVLTPFPLCVSLGSYLDPLVTPKSFYTSPTSVPSRLGLSAILIFDIFKIQNLVSTSWLSQPTSVTLIRWMCHGWISPSTVT